MPKPYNFREEKRTEIIIDGVRWVSIDELQEAYDEINYLRTELAKIKNTKDKDLG